MSPGPDTEPDGPLDPLPDQAEYRARWSALHGGYDPAGSALVDGWLAAVEKLARPLARRGTAPDRVTGAGLFAAALAVPAAVAGGRWNLAAAAAVLGSGLADSLDGAVAALSDRATPWGYVLDSLADRVSDAAYLLALGRAGAPRWVTTAAAGGITALEYSRARAGNAGFGEIGVVTVGERPTRIIVTAGGLVLAGLVPRRARAVATVTAAVVGGLSAVGTGEFLRVAQRGLQGSQAGPMSSATARPDKATSGSPPPG